MSALGEQRCIYQTLFQAWEMRVLHAYHKRNHLIVYGS